MVQLKVIQDLRKQKQDQTYPIYLRITELKKVMYLSTGFSVLKEHWDMEASKVVKSHANASVINAALSKRYFETQKTIIQLEDSGRFSFNNLKDELKPKKQVQSLQGFAEQLIVQMLSQKKTGNALVYRTAINMVSNFKHGTGLSFIDVDLKFLQDFQAYLIQRGVKVNTISNYLRTLRAIYNKAVQAKVVDRKYYPFDGFTIKSERTIKRSITRMDMVKIEHLNASDDKQMEKARDLFLLSFYLIGISFTDLIYITKENIVNGRIVYRRRKTNKLYSIKLLPKVKQLMEKYESKGSKYLLPILPDSIVEDSIEAKKLIHQVIKTTNKYLARLANLIALDMKLTTYAARHTFATIAKRLGHSNEMIAEALGHEYGNRTTSIYLDSFDKQEIDKMHKHVIS